jgi:hypothetical protein
LKTAASVSLAVRLVRAAELAADLEKFPELVEDFLRLTRLSND